MLNAYSETSSSVPGPPYELINSPISSSDPAPHTIRAGSSPNRLPIASRNSSAPPSGYRKSSAAVSRIAASAAGGVPNAPSFDESLMTRFCPTTLLSPPT